MCTHKSWIYNSRGRKILVDCGHCPSCLQSKAIRRTNKIRATYPENGDLVSLFVTLTYSNMFIPYFHLADLKNSLPKRNLQSPLYKVRNKDISLVNGRVFDRDILNNVSSSPLNKVDSSTYIDLPIYRDCSVRYNRYSSSYSTRKSFHYEPTVVDTLSIPDNVLPLGLHFHMGEDFVNSYANDDDRFHFLLPYDDSSFSRPFIPLKGQRNPNKIGVIYYPDLQNFIKRLKINLLRHYGLQNNFQYFCCAEYGPKTCRPHFHLLIFCSRTSVQAYKRAIVESWPYDNYNLTYKNISIAKDAAAYVASYVNCFATIPRLFAMVRQISPRCSYSHGFGLALREFSLPAIVEAFYQRDLRVHKQVVRKQCLTDVSFLLPKYVIYRYFPKFKGYYRLTTDEVASILERPSRVYNYINRLDLVGDDAYRIFVRLTNCKRRCLQFISESDYVHVGSRIWSLYSANVLQDFYNSLSNPFDNCFAYDNILDFVSGDVDSPNLQKLWYDYDIQWCLSPNDTPSNVLSTLSLEASFHSYSKDRKIRNDVYSKFLNV